MAEKKNRQLKRAPGRIGDTKYVDTISKNIFINES